MVARGVSSLTCQPVRELVCPHLEEPNQRASGDPERRRNHRYARQLPGVLVLNGCEHPITCVDIGYGGIQVIAPPTLSVTHGTHVIVRFTRDGRSFQDEFSVVHCEHTSDGTVLHLGL